MRKGIVLAGGHGTRLFPATQPVSKQLLPVYDKPMVYYPLTTLMLAGIRDILVITTPQEQQRFIDALGDGSQWGIRLQYAEQLVPAGIAEALRIGREFLAGSPVALILGDNIFFGHDLAEQLRRASARDSGATVFAYQVSDPQRYGVIEFDADSRVISLEEKPLSPKSSFVVTGLYFYDEKAPDIAASLEPSARGELEITDLNQRYLDKGELDVQLMGQGYAWLDMGTPDSLLDAANFIATLQKRQGLMVACPEEVALRQQWISVEQVARQAHMLRQSQYGAYLQRLAGEFAGKEASCG